MNIHHVTDLIEDSIRHLDVYLDDDAAFCADVRTLYDFQDRYSTRSTYFRVMPMLVRRGYFVGIPLKDHPDWETYRDELEGLEADGVSPLLEDPGADWDEASNPVVGYVQDDQLFVEAGTDFAERLVEAGAISDDEADAPEAAELTAAVDDACRAALAEDDEDTLLLWYTNLSFHFVMADDVSDDDLLERLQSDSHLRGLREMVAEFDDLEMKLGHPDCPAEMPPYPLRQQHPVLKWWYGV